DDKEIEKQDDEMGSLEVRNEETRIIIPTPLSSSRKILSSDKKTFEELTDTVSNPTISASKHSIVKKIISSKYSYLPEALHRMCSDLIETNQKPCIVNTIIEDRGAFHSEIPAFVSQEFKAHAPAIIEDLFKNHALIHKFKKSSSNTSCIKDAFHSNHNEHQDDDAPPKGEKRLKISKESKRSKSAKGSSLKHLRKDSTTYVSKQQSQQQEWDAWEEENVIDEDEVIPKYVTPELMAESHNVDKRGKRLKISKESKRSKSAKGSSLKHLRKDSTTYVSKQQSQQQEWDAWEEENVIDKDEVIPKDVTPELMAESHNVDKQEFLELDLEEKLKRWVRKEFKTINEDASKEEKTVMYLEEIVKFCDATLEKVLNENSKRESIPMQEKLKLSKSQGASTPAEVKHMQNVPYALAVRSIMIDYEKTISPIADIRAIRILIAITAFYDYEIWQMDVKTTFFNGYLSEEVYMEQPEGFVNLKFPNRVCKFKRFIYGIKQASTQ
nr:retrovirus-related Pol polyprotein from transposon TNT 1-94 [Tanacetum cinerariifolium]